MTERLIATCATMDSNDVSKLFAGKVRKRYSSMREDKSNENVYGHTAGYTYVCDVGRKS